MTNILQRNWFTAVDRDATSGMLDARTVYRDTDCEVGARLRVNSTTFRIKQAVFEKYSPEMDYIEVPGLQGVEAYFHCGPALTEAVADLGNLPRSLFAETVRGIIQAETFLLEERGFASAREYSDYWEKLYLNSCRYYSNLHRISCKWDEYAGQGRRHNLFNRFKGQLVYKDCTEGYKVIGSLSDSFHELGVSIVINGDLIVTEARGALLRAPDKVCFEAADFLNNLAGKFLMDMNKKQVAVLLGKGEGCVHLIDTVYDALESIKIAVTKEDGNT